MKLNAFFVTLFSGLSFYIGYVITKIIKDEKKLSIFAVGFAFSIMLGLCFFDMLPECMEMASKPLMFLCMLGGILLLKVLDLFIPDHEHTHKKDHIEHIGVISSIALFLHNTIEGTAIYTTSSSNLKMGLLMALGVSCHNIPLGIQTSSLVRNKKERIGLLSLLALSSIFGVLIIDIFNITINEMITQILICISFGMLMYISLFELLCEVKDNIKKRELLYGLLCGLIIIFLGIFIH